MKFHVKIFLAHTISWAINEIQILLNEIYKSRLWKKGTTLIVGDSMLYGIDETRLHNTKVRLFPGSMMEDMYLNIYPPLLRKYPTNIFLVIGTNNAKTDNSIQVAEKLVKLREYILSIIPTCSIIISPLFLLVHAVTYQNVLLFY